MEPTRQRAGPLAGHTACRLPPLTQLRQGRPAQFEGCSARTPQRPGGTRAGTVSRGAAYPANTRSTPCWYSRSSMLSRIASPSPCTGDRGPVHCGLAALPHADHPSCSYKGQHKLSSSRARRLSGHWRTTRRPGQQGDNKGRQHPGGGGSGGRGQLPAGGAHLVGVVGVVPGGMEDGDHPGRARAVQGRQVAQQPGVLLGGPAVGCRGWEQSRGWRGQGALGLGLGSRQCGEGVGATFVTKA